MPYFFKMWNVHLAFLNQYLLKKYQLILNQIWNARQLSALLSYNRITLTRAKTWVSIISMKKSHNNCRASVETHLSLFCRLFSYCTNSSECSPSLFDRQLSVMRSDLSPGYETCTCSGWVCTGSTQRTAEIRAQRHSSTHILISSSDHTHTQHSLMSVTWHNIWR